jgi:sugar phosphate isomerase/epimerase
MVESGGILCYHNHWWEFEARADGSLPIDDFLDALDPAVPLVVDVYWLAAAGASPVEMLKTLGPRIRHIHLKDGPATIDGFQVPIGQGEIDIASVVAAVPTADWHVAELDDCESDPLEALRESYDYLTDLGTSFGREGDGEC